MPLILGTNSIKDTGYDVANSVRFNDADSSSMTKASTTVTNDKKFTISAWCKRSTLGSSSQFGIFSHISDSNNANKNLQFGFYQDHIYCAFVDGGSVTVNKVSNASYRDVSAWYHVMLAVDSTQGTAANRNRIYVNGTEITSFSTDTNAGADETFLSTSCNISVGRYTNTGGSHFYFDGYLAEVVYIDGLQLTPSSFGEFNEDSPTIWQPIDVSGLTFGNNGFYLDFEDSSNLGNDANGGTDLTESNLTAVDQSIDSCTNNFATWDPNNRNTSMGSFHHGNLEYEVDASFFRTAFATFGASQGKWYFECKRVIGSSFSIGIISLDYKNRTSNVSYIGGAGNATNNIGYLKDGNISIGGSETSGYASYGNGETVMVAMDLDNGKVYFGVDGTWGNSGNPESGATGTGAVSFTPSGETWTFAVSVFDSHWEANFGSPMYAISSGNSDGEGLGNFEFSVPANYFSMCTKNLAEYG